MFRQSIAVLGFILISATASASSMQDLLRMSEQIDQSDANELRSLLKQADDCSLRRDFSCASSFHSKAQAFANDSNGRNLLAQSRKLMENERLAQQQAAEREEKRREAQERAEAERQRRLDEREAALSRAQSNASIAAHLAQSLQSVQNYAAQSGAQVARATADYERRRMELERDRERERERVERDRENRQQADRERAERERSRLAAAPAQPASNYSTNSTPSGTTAPRSEAPALQIAQGPTSCPPGYSPSRDPKAANPYAICIKDSDNLPVATAPAPVANNTTASGNASVKAPSPDCKPGVQFATYCDQSSRNKPQTSKTYPIAGGSTNGGNSTTGGPGSGGGEGSQERPVKPPVSGTGKDKDGESGSGESGKTTPKKPGYIYQKVTAGGEWKECAGSRESARFWAKLGLESNVMKACRELGPGWNFSFQFETLGYEQAKPCKDGKSWNYEFSGASAICRKWQ